MPSFRSPIIPRPILRVGAVAWLAAAKGWPGPRCEAEVNRQLDERLRSPRHWRTAHYALLARRQPCAKRRSTWTKRHAVPGVIRKYATTTTNAGEEHRELKVKGQRRPDVTPDEKAKLLAVCHDSRAEEPQLSVLADMYRIWSRQSATCPASRNPHAVSSAMLPGSAGGPGGIPPSDLRKCAMAPRAALLDSAPRELPLGAADRVPRTCGRPPPTPRHQKAAG